MGETQRHIHAFAPEQFQPMIEAIKQIAEAFGGIVPEPETPLPEPSPEPLDAWSFYSPKHQGMVTAFLDPQNQVRHVVEARVSEVPKTWRRIRLDPPRT